MIVVADGDPPLLAPLLAAAEVSGVAITPIGPVGRRSRRSTPRAPRRRLRRRRYRVGGRIGVRRGVDARCGARVCVARRRPRGAPRRADLRVARAPSASRRATRPAITLWRAPSTPIWRRPMPRPISSSDDSPAPERILAWITDRTADDVEVTEVCFATADGWEIHGDGPRPPPRQTRAGRGAPPHRSQRPRRVPAFSSIC